MTSVPEIDPFSLRPLYLWQATASGGQLGSGTGFVVKHGGMPFFVTNLHVVSGRDVNTGKQLSKTQCPDKLTIFHHVSDSMASRPGVWTPRDESLVDESTKPLWTEHPQKDIRDWDNFDKLVVDIATFPLREVDELVKIYDVTLSTTPDVMIRPGIPLHIVGFPFGLRSEGFFPIWKTGHIASDFDDELNDRFFLIDASTRPGMSGSPVLFRPLGPYLDKAGNVQVGRGNDSLLMGIYSGRLHPDSDVGIVWRTSKIIEVLDEALRREKGPDGSS